MNAAVVVETPPTFCFDHGAVSVPDIEASIAWYRDVLGFEVARRFDLPHGVARGAMLLRGVMRMEIFEPSDGVDLPDARRHPDTDVRLHGNKHVAFRTDDLAELTRWLHRCDVDIAMTVGGPFGSAVFIRDNAGNLIEFLAQPAAGAAP